MRYAFKPDHMEASGVLAVRKSSTHTSRKTIRMQINDLYSDKPGAIVREITANADDSHRRAQQDRPFYVHVPTALEPEFYVRDFGCGMTDQVMDEVYIVIGLSDKDESDDETGMWGLGSKTPFGYADQYTISCFDGETARHYGYGIADDGIPTLYTLAVEPSDEPRGVRIGLAVEAQDFHLFEEAVRFAAVAHQGRFEHNLGAIDTGTLAYQGDGWQAYTDSPLAKKISGYGGSQSWWVRQGTVLYQIADAQIVLPRDARGGLNSQRVYILDCPIGTVRMTPSREALQYDADTVAYLKERIAQVQEDIGQAVEDATKDIVSVVDYFEKVADLKPSFVTRAFTHPLTGLSAPIVKLGYPALLFSAARGQNHGGEWGFDAPSQLDLRTLSHDTRKRNFYVLADVTPLLDPSRGPQDADAGATQWLTRSEMRRISRFVRHYLESQGLSNALFACNTDWSDDYIQAITTQAGVKTAVTRITFDSLRAAVPRRVAPPTPAAKSPPIRGLALAKGAGEQKPVYEVKPAEASIAWVASDEYRRQAGPLFKLARRTGIESLYIAAEGDAQARMTDAGHPHLSARLTEHFAAKGWTLATHEFMRTAFTQSYGNKSLDFLRTLKSVSPDQYARLAQGEGVYSALAAALSRYIAKPLLSLSDEEQRVLEVLCPASAAKAPKKLAEAKAIFDTIVPSYYNPTSKFVAELTPSAARAEAIVSAVLALQTLLPPTERH